MKSNTQNAKIEAITEKTLVLGIDVGSETHYARAFDYRGIEYSKKPFKFSNTEAGFVTFKEWILDLKERHDIEVRPYEVKLQCRMIGCRIARELYRRNIRVNIIGAWKQVSECKDEFTEIRNIHFDENP